MRSLWTKVTETNDEKQFYLFGLCGRVYVNMHVVAAADYNNIGKFLNRILGMAVQQQNALFQYFSDTLAAVIQEAKKNGRYDMGILGKTDFV